MPRKRRLDFWKGVSHIGTLEGVSETTFGDLVTVVFCVLSARRLPTRLISAALFGTTGALTAPRPFCGNGYRVLTRHVRALLCLGLGVACEGVAIF